jgi:hypothetical protein
MSGMAAYTPRAVGHGVEVADRQHVADAERLSDVALALDLAHQQGEAGIIPEDELGTYGSDDSRLPMSGMAAYTPGMEISPKLAADIAASQVEPSSSSPSENRL